MPATVRIPAKRGKYGSRITEYNGRKYHSAAEAKQAAELDLIGRAGRISWQPQMPIPITVGGKYICTVILDFWVVDNNTGKQHYIEVKGHETAVYRLKLKLLKACYPDIDLRIVKA